MPSWQVNFGLHVKLQTTGLIQELAAIHANAMTISGIPLPPATSARLHRLNIVRAVRGTTGLEGTQLSEEEVDGVLFDAAPIVPATPAGRPRDQQEVLNAHALTKFVEQRLRSAPGTPLTEDLVRKFHEILTTGINYPGNTPAHYRSRKVTVGAYSAPDHADVPALMADFIQWVNGSEASAMGPIVRAIVAHFLLVSIHPFGDGNGRTSRAVESFLLYKAGVNVRGFYSLANYYYQHRDRYIELLDHVRFVTDPDVTPFVRFAVDGLVEELKRVHREVINEVRMIAFRDFARERIDMDGGLGRPTGQRQLNVVHDLRRDQAPLHAIRSGGHQVAQYYRGLGAKTFTRDINTLKGMGLITVVGGTVSANLGVIDAYVPGDGEP